MPLPALCLMQFGAKQVYVDAKDHPEVMGRYAQTAKWDGIERRFWSRWRRDWKHATCVQTSVHDCFDGGDDENCDVVGCKPNGTPAHA